VAPVEASLIDEGAMAHDFGPVVSRPGRKLDHRYHLRNATAHDVTIVNVINRKTCCGIVRVGKTLLHSGDETEIDVTLVVGDKFGSVVHETEVVTDPPPPRELVLRTSAEAHAALRIEGDSSSVPTVLLGAGKPQRIGFRVFACGTATEPPVDLDRIALRSTVWVEWAGPKEDGPDEDGLKVESRRFSVSLEPAGPLGERTAQVVLLDGDRNVLSHVVNWTVVSAITASPKLVVFKSGQRTSRVLIHAGDQKPFRVKRVECQTPGVQGRVANPAAAVTQVIDIEGAPARPEGGRGVFTVFTDHPSQEQVDLPFVVID
jgi:hypothetical protein